MTKGKALDGKPHAGNPHVRLDEGEVAQSAKPRRGAPFCKSGNASKKKVDGMVLGAVLLGIATVSPACGDVVLWHHFDERAPGDTAQANDVFTNSVSESCGSGRAYSINTGTAPGSDPAFMPKFAVPCYVDNVYDPVSGTAYANAASISFRTEGTSSALAGGAVVIADDPKFRLDNYTVECFVCTTGGTFNTIAPIVGKIYGNAFTSESWQIGMLTNGKLFMRFSGSNSSTTGEGSHVINDGVWHHLALTCSYDATKNESTYTMYVDYVEDFARTATGSTRYGTVAGQNDIYVGGYRHAGRKFNGMIDELRISDKALSPSQFLCRLLPPFIDSDTIVWMPFDGYNGMSALETPNLVRSLSSTAKTVGNVPVSIYSNDVVSATLRDNYIQPPACGNLTSVFFRTNGVAGSGSCVRTADCDYFVTNFTAELFFKTAGKIKPGVSQTLLKISESPYLQLTLDNTHPGQIILAYGNMFNGAASPGTWTNGGYYGTNLDDGKWHHVAVVYDADNLTLKLYIDLGLAIAKNNVRLSPEAAICAIGSNVNATGQFFHGWIDSVRITRKALEATEFLNVSHGVYNVDVDTLFYFPCDDGLEAFANGMALVGNGLVHETGNAMPTFSPEVRYAELLHDGEGGSNVHTNKGSAYMDGSMAYFQNVTGIGNQDQTAEFFCKFTSIPILAGLLRVNCSSDSVLYGVPVWALYGDSPYLQIRCSTVTNGVVNHERYLSLSVPTSSLCDDKWHHVALAVQSVDEGANTQFTLYVDRVQRSQVKVTGMLYTSAAGNGVALGAASQHALGGITGYIDEVRITRGILPPSRFLCRYRRPRGIAINFR